MKIDDFDAEEFVVGKTEWVKNVATGVTTDGDLVLRHLVSLGSGAVFGRGNEIKMAVVDFGVDDVDFVGLETGAVEIDFFGRKFGRETDGPAAFVSDDVGDNFPIKINWVHTADFGR